MLSLKNKQQKRLDMNKVYVNVKKNVFSFFPILFLLIINFFFWFFYYKSTYLWNILIELTYQASKSYFFYFFYF